MPIEFTPKAVINCYEPKNRYNQKLIQELKSFFKENQLNDFIKYYNYADPEVLAKGAISEEFKRLESNDKFSIFGEDRAEIVFDYICIILMNSDNKTEKINKLDQIKSSTYLNSIQQNVWYIIVDKNKLDLSSSTQDDNVDHLEDKTILQILITQEDDKGTTIKKNRYFKIVQNTIKILSILTKPQIIQYIFRHNIHNIISINSELITKPAKQKKRKIDKYFLKSLYNKINNQSGIINFEYDELYDGYLDDIENYQIKKTPRIKIPLFKGQSGRYKHIKQVNDRYQHQLNGQINEYLKKQKEQYNLNFYNYDSAVAKIRGNIKENIEDAYKIKPIIDGLKNLKKDIDNRLKENKERISWKFVKNMPEIKISGIPFNLISLIIFLVFIAGLLLYRFLGNPGGLIHKYYILFIIGYIPIILLISFVYLKNRNSYFSSLISNIRHSARLFLKNNRSNFELVKESYLNKILGKKLDTYISKLKEVKENIEKKYNNLLELNSEQKLTEDEIEIVESVLDDRMDKTIQKIAKNYYPDIYRFLDDIIFFEECSLAYFHSSEIYNEIKDKFRKKDEIDKKYIQDVFKGIRNLPVPPPDNKDYVKSNLLIYSDNIESISQMNQISNKLKVNVIDDYIGFLNIGLINE